MNRDQTTMQRANVRRGFTLTEVLVASSLLVVAMVPVLQALTITHQTSSKIEHKTMSVLLAQMKLDDVKARLVYDYASSYDESHEELATNFRCTTRDTEVNDNLRRITVSVGYDTDEDRRLDTDEINVTFQTLVAKRWGS